MKTLKKLILKLWNWLKDQTEIDEKIEEKVDDIKEDFDDVVEEVKRRYNRVKEEIDDVKESTSEVIKQVDDVAKAVGGSKRKGRKPSTTKITKSALRVMKKAELLKTAKKEFKIDLDSKLTKSNLVNKVYELYHKK
jgi:ferritin-like metal-binding protein YciE